MNVYGYIRVSSRDQNEDRQLIALHGKGVEDRIVKEQLKQQDKEMQEVISASSSEAENDGEKKMPFFLPRKHSEKNYYTDSD